jgi:hypothetical protein
MQTVTNPSPRGPARALAVLVLAPLLASACIGNPFAPKDTAAQQKRDAEQAQLKWAQCMREHGINVPDPGPNRGGLQVQVTDQQQFDDAQKACQRYMPKGGNGPGKLDPKVVDQLTKFAQCMREHGIPIPDPQVSSDGAVQIKSGDPGAIDPGSDQFQQAEQACKQYAPKGGPTSRSTSG